MRPPLSRDDITQSFLFRSPAEIIYWLQLKGVFDYYKIEFPIIMPRNFGMIIHQNIARKIKTRDCK